MSDSNAPSSHESSVQSAPPTPRVAMNPAPEPRLRLAQLVHSLAHRRDARLLGEFLQLRATVR